MAKQVKTTEERLEEFFSDPAHAEEATFMRGAVKRVLSEIAEGERQKQEEEEKNKPKGFFQQLNDFLK